MTADQLAERSPDKRMRAATRLALMALGATAGARALLFVAYGILRVSWPLDVWDLESKMVLLAWRVQAGLWLYPEWHDYPHVSNFFGPIYFVLVGTIGRLAGASLGGLFVIGRTVTFLAGIATSLVVGHEARRRYGIPAGILGAAASLGAAPMEGFGLMVRPDTLAELFGVFGFFLVVREAPRARLAGAGLLLAAVFTKQTTAVFLAAAAATLALEGRRRLALGLLAGISAAAVVIVAIVTATVEPHLAASLIAEGSMPWSGPNWLLRVGRLVREAPDLILFAALGPGIWLASSRPDRTLAALAITLTATCFLTAGKYGSDLNYFLSLRVVEGLAVAALASRLLHPPTNERSARLWLALGFVAALAFLPGDRYTRRLAREAWLNRQFTTNPSGGFPFEDRQKLERLAGDPRVLVLTDSARFQLQQRQHAPFGDPWLFRVQVDRGLIRPDRIREQIESEAYDYLLLREVLHSPAYETFVFGLPMPLTTPARDHYRLARTYKDVYIYVPAHREPQVPLPSLRD